MVHKVQNHIFYHLQHQHFMPATQFQPDLSIVTTLCSAQKWQTMLFSPRLRAKQRKWCWEDLRLQEHYKMSESTMHLNRFSFFDKASLGCISFYALLKSPRLPCTFFFFIWRIKLYGEERPWRGCQALRKRPSQQLMIIRLSFQRPLNLNCFHSLQLHVI